jgi:flagellar basal-body rod protein FlgB
MRSKIAACRQTLAATRPLRRENPLFRELARCLLKQMRNAVGASPMSESLFGIHAAALELRSQRMGLITSNIANAATPGYKARDIDFATALKARMSGMSGEQAAQAASLYRVPVMPSLDGNTVELPTEQIAFSENAVGYSATLSFIRGRVDTLTRALKGE